MQPGTRAGDETMTNYAADTWALCDHLASKIVGRGAGATVADRDLDSDQLMHSIQRAAAARGMVLLYHGQRGRYVLAVRGGKVDRMYNGSDSSESN